MTNVMDMLGGAAKKKTTKKKSETPTVELENTQKNMKVFKDFVRFKLDEKAATASKKKAEEKLKPTIVAARKKYCMEQKYHSSVKIAIGGETPITASFQRKCSKISTEHQERLQELFGDDYERCFRTVTKINLKDEAMQDIENAAKEGKPSIMNKLMDALGGPEEFFKVFEVEQELAPRDYLYEGAVSDKDIAPKAQAAIEEELWKPQMPSLSV
jgi:hypothetical protein